MVQDPHPAGGVVRLQGSTQQVLGGIYGAKAQYYGADIRLQIPADGRSVTFLYDPVTHWITDDVNSKIVTAGGSPGELVSSWPGAVFARVSIAEGTTTSPREVRPWPFPACETAITACLASDPADRATPKELTAAW